MSQFHWYKESYESNNFPLNTDAFFVPYVAAGSLNLSVGKIIMMVATALTFIRTGQR